MQEAATDEKGMSQLREAVRFALDEAARLGATQAAGDASMEVWDASRNTDLLAKALDLEVELVAGVWMGCVAGGWRLGGRRNSWELVGTRMSS